MAPIAKEPEPQNSPSPSPNSTQKVQPVALEIAVTVNGARSVEGTDKREPFSETTQTVLVFGNGAVIRLNSSVAPGQLLFLTNEKTKKEVVCQVVKSKNYRSVSGYVELEFTEPAVGFWGMRFPSDKIGTAPAPSGVSSAPLKPAPVVSASNEPISTPAPQPAKPVILPPPSSAPVSVAPPIAIAPPPAPVTPAPVNAAPANSSAARPVDNATEELKKQAARLQEQLSSMLFSEAPSKQGESAPPVAPPAVSDEAGKVFEIAKAQPPAPQEKLDPTPVPKTFEPLNLTPIAQKTKPAASLHDEEVKIPSWLEPLARNAATPAPPAQSVPQPPLSITAPVALADDLDAQVAGESYDFGAQSEAASAPVTATETQAPNFSSDLFANTEVTDEQPAEGGSKKGIWIGAIAATILLAAGGTYWYLQQSGHASASTTTTTSAAALSQPISQPVTQQQSQTFLPASSPQNQLQNQTKTYNTVPSQVNSQPSNTGSALVAPATEVQKIPANHEMAKPASAPTTSHTSESAATHASEPVEDNRKSNFSQIRLAAPTVKGSSTQNLAPAEADPGIALENNAATPVGSALGGTHGNQPAAPIPVGGEVKQAVLISSVPPVYPQMARTQRVGGDVKIDALIDEHGRVSSMKVVSGPAMLYQAAQDALRQWKYRPATLNGQAVSMHLLVTIQFKLQ
jgi:TonB family protein